MSDKEQLRFSCEELQWLRLCPEDMCRPHRRNSCERQGVCGLNKKEESLANCRALRYIPAEVKEIGLTGRRKTMTVTALRDFLYGKKGKKP